LFERDDEGAGDLDRLSRTLRKIAGAKRELIQKVDGTRN
jgi:hypothetical protein